MKNLQRSDQGCPRESPERTSREALWTVVVPVETGVRAAGGAIGPSVCKETRGSRLKPDTGVNVGAGLELVHCPVQSHGESWEERGPLWLFRVVPACGMDELMVAAAVYRRCPGSLRWTRCGGKGGLDSPRGLEMRAYSDWALL